MTISTYIFLATFATYYMYSTMCVTDEYYYGGNTHFVDNLK